MSRLLTAYVPVNANILTSSYLNKNSAVRGYLCSSHLWDSSRVVTSLSIKSLRMTSVWHPGPTNVGNVLALKRAAFSLADVQCNVLLPSCLHVTAFSIDQRFVDDVLWYAWPCVNEALLQVAGHSGWCRRHVFVQCTHVPASVLEFGSQPDCLGDTDL